MGGKEKGGTGRTREGGRERERMEDRQAGMQAGSPLFCKWGLFCVHLSDGGVEGDIAQSRLELLLRPIL